MLIRENLVSPRRPYIGPPQYLAADPMPPSPHPGCPLPILGYQRIPSGRLDLTPRIDTPFLRWTIQTGLDPVEEMAGGASLTRAQSRLSEAWTLRRRAQIIRLQRRMIMVDTVQVEDNAGKLTHLLPSYFYITPTADRSHRPITLCCWCRCSKTTNVQRDPSSHFE